MSTGMCWYLRVESSPTFYYVEVLSTHQYQMCLCTFGSLYGSRAPPHASRGWERMRVGRGRMNSGKIWIRIFQSTMHPSIHVFIHPIHSHFHSEWFVHPKSPAAAQVTRAYPLGWREVGLPSFRTAVSHRRWKRTRKESMELRVRIHGSPRPFLEESERLQAAPIIMHK